jgi:hypothetical protein
MKARKWLSNLENVIKQVPLEDQATVFELSDDNCKTVKTLYIGISWDSKEDIFKICASARNITVLMKRSILITIASIFNPLGLLANLFLWER